MNKEARPFEEYKEMIQDMSKDNMIKGLYDLSANIIEKDKEIERLNKENNDLKKLYQRTYKHLFDVGKDELARYFQAQIDECPTFYVEPIIDYYEEYKKLNNIIEELEKYIKEMPNNEYFGYLKQDLLDKLKELKEGK